MAYKTKEKKRDSQRNHCRRFGSRFGNISLRRLHLLPGPWIAVDLKSATVLDGSRHFDDMMAVDKRDYLRRPISIFTAPPQQSLWFMKPFDRSLLSVVGRHEDVVLQSADGRRIVADVHVSKGIRIGGSRVAVCLITDETERHRLQSELITKHKELRKTFTDLERQSETLTRMNLEIGEMSAQLSRASSLAAVGEITAELTHQLNNPLAGAVAAARRIQMFLGDNVDERVKEMLPLLKDSLERLRVTMNDLKRVYRNSRSTDHPMEPVDLKAQTDSAVMLMQQRLHGVNLEIDIAEDTEILARPGEVQHILVNLIDNALHAAGDQGRIRVSAHATDGKILFSVEDNGPGIPTAEQEKVFEPFFTTREQGSGLGLSVVRRNVQNNKAEIRVGRSELGGASFEIGFISATPP